VPSSLTASPIVCRSASSSWWRVFLLEISRFVNYADVPRNWTRDPKRWQCTAALIVNLNLWCVLLILLLCCNALYIIMISIIIALYFSTSCHCNSAIASSFNSARKPPHEHMRIAMTIKKTKMSIVVRVELVGVVVIKNKIIQCVSPILSLWVPATLTANLWSPGTAYPFIDHVTETCGNY